MTVTTTPGASGADAYADPATVAAYAAKLGLTFDADAASAEADCRVGAKWIDATYRNRFPGCPTNADQALEFPRTGVWYRGAELPSDAIPQQIIDAQCEASIRNQASPGSLAPDIGRDSYIKSLQAGSVQIEYGGAIPLNTMFQTIDGILAPILGDAPSPYSMKAVRA
jgi:hypothetical protein